eukprot:m.163106 g.163106  ORF g.163106 m.163106 type:complete len:836 (-) comp24906_c0_seq4:160-2667(-)
MHFLLLSLLLCWQAAVTAATTNQDVFSGSGSGSGSGDDYDTDVCPPFTLANGFDDALSLCARTEGAECTAVCRPGYYLSEGDPVYICQEDGQWIGEATCLPRDCGPPPVPTLGERSDCAQTTFGSVCTLKCQRGYHLRVPAHRRVTCEVNGWSQIMADCEDFDACSTNPCGPSSTCVDLEPPFTGHRCDCLPGFRGTPGIDGAGCLVPNVAVTRDGGLKVQVPDDGSITLQSDDHVSRAGFSLTPQGIMSSLKVNSNKLGLVEDLVQVLVDEVQAHTNKISSTKVDIGGLSRMMARTNTEMSNNVIAIQDHSNQIASAATSTAQCSRSRSTIRQQLNSETLPLSRTASAKRKQTANSLNSVSATIVNHQSRMDAVSDALKSVMPLISDNQDLASTLRVNLDTKINDLSSAATRALSAIVAAGQEETEIVTKRYDTFYNINSGTSFKVTSFADNNAIIKGNSQSAGTQIAVLNQGQVFSGTATNGDWIAGANGQIHVTGSSPGHRPWAPSRLRGRKFGVPVARSNPQRYFFLALEDATVVIKRGTTTVTTLTMTKGQIKTTKQSREGQGLWFDSTGDILWTQVSDADKNSGRGEVDYMIGVPAANEAYYVKTGTTYVTAYGSSSGKLGIKCTSQAFENWQDGTTNRLAAPGSRVQAWGGQACHATSNDENHLFNAIAVGDGTGGDGVAFGTSAHFDTQFYLLFEVAFVYILSNKPATIIVDADPLCVNGVASTTYSHCCPKACGTCGGPGCGGRGTNCCMGQITRDCRSSKDTACRLNANFDPRGPFTLSGRADREIFKKKINWGYPEGTLFLADAPVQMFVDYYGSDDESIVFGA